MAIEGIPVSFEFKGKEYSGHLSYNAGFNTSSFHLMIDNYYYGQFGLMSTGWILSSNKPEWDNVPELNEYFERVVTAWFG